jgi:hypothetical protein
MQMQHPGAFSMLANREMTPDLISEDILTFTDDLGAAPPVYLSVSPPPDALVGGRAENIERQCRLLGGTPLFGRAIFSADDLYLVSEFHCVVSTPQGPIDVTPSPTGETRTLFAAYPRLADQTGLYRPNIRARVYGAADKKAEVEGKLLDATDADETSARKNGITLRQLLLSKLPRDPLAAQIDDYLRAEGKLEALIVSAHDGTRNWDPSQFPGLGAEFQRLDRRRRDLYEAYDRQKGLSAAGNQFK